MTGLRTKESTVTGSPSPFASLAGMQERHSALVKEIGNDVLAVGNPDSIAEFIHRGVATGRMLDAREDRAAAQSLINFWVSRSPPRPVTPGGRRPTEQSPFLRPPDR